MTTKEVANIDELKKLLEEFYGFNVCAIKFVNIGYDIRNDWQTYLVLADFDGITPGCPVGYSDRCLEIESDIRSHES